MSAQAMSLEQIQREMAAAVMQPLTADEDMRETAADGRSMRAVAESFIAPSSECSAFERLEIYNRQYWFRILGALAEDYPALRAVLGQRAFDAMSVAYLTKHPSRSFSLRNLGSHLVEWLRAHPEFAGKRPRLALDVARIEWAFVEAFDLGERDPLTLEQIATLDGGSRLALQPHLTLIALDYPADDLVLSLHSREKRGTSEAGLKHEDGPDAPAALPPLRPRATWLAAHRADQSVYYIRLEREEFRTLSALREGRTLIDAIDSGFTGSRVAQARRPQMLRDWFAHWAELAWICAPELE